MAFQHHLWLLQQLLLRGPRRDINYKRGVQGRGYVQLARLPSLYGRYPCEMTNVAFGDRLRNSKLLK